MSVLGAGLLVGTALAVIIPEGLQALLAGAGPDHEDVDKSIGMALAFGFLFMLLIAHIATLTSSKDPEAQTSRSQHVTWTTTLGKTL